MPDPPDEFINLSSSSYKTQRHPTVDLNTDTNVTIPSSERKLVPILKTPPTMQRSTYSSETN